MASFVTNEGSHRMTVGGGTSVNWDTSTALYARLGTTSWSPTKDETAMTSFAAATGADDVSVAAGNTSIAKNTTDDRIELKYNTTLTFTTVTGSQTVGWVAIYVEDAAADATRVPLIFIDVADTATNGGDITISFSGNSDVVAYLQQ